MDTQTQEQTVPPPRLITSLRAGFDTVANHIGLILFPVALDLFLWLGPHFSLKSLLEPFIQQIATMPGLNTPEMTDIIKASQEMWQTLATHLNLASALRTFPVGIPSLMAGQFPIATPFGQPSTMDISSLGHAFSLWIMFILIGLVGGSLYFNTVAQVIVNGNGNRSLSEIGWVTTQSILLTAAWIALLLAVSIPTLLFLSVLALISMTAAQLAILLISVILVWILVPLLFSPHGIYMYHQNALYSILTSIRLVRFMLPGTGLFFLTVIVLSQGLDLLWQVPPADSWMSLVGVAGHAFITTGLLAASFIYYRDALQWVQSIVQRPKAAGTAG